MENFRKKMELARQRSKRRTGRKPTPQK